MAPASNAARQFTRNSWAIRTDDPDRHNFFTMIDEALSLETNCFPESSVEALRGHALTL